MRNILIILILAIALICSGFTLRVPQDYPTTQQAVDKALPGDTVKVDAGKYGVVTVTGKNDITLLGNGFSGQFTSVITYSSKAGIELIDCSGWKISGFDISNVFQGVRLIRCKDIEVCSVYAHNSYLHYSVGAAIQECDGIYYHHNIVEEQEYSGLWMRDSKNLRIVNNTIVYNQQNGVILMTHDPNLVFVNNIIAFNYGDGVESIPIQDGAIVNFNDNFGNQANNWYHLPLGIGNIEADPLFRNRPLSDYNLTRKSKCIDAGAPEILDPDMSESDIGALFYEQLQLIPIPETIKFPAAAENGYSKVQLILENHSAGNISIDRIRIQPEGVFSTAGVNPGISIPPGGETGLWVVFKPKELKNYQGLLEIEQSNGRLTIDLLGPQAMMSFSADTLVFPNTYMGKNETLPLTIYNKSEMDFRIAGVEIDQQGFFTDWTEADSFVVMGDSIELNVSFAPALPILHSGAVRFISNAGNNEVYLQGLESSASISVDIIPFYLDITIPASGGSFNYNMQIVNSALSMNVNISVMVILPDGREMEIYRRDNIGVNSISKVSWFNCVQWVPQNMPPGEYIYNCYLRDSETGGLISEDQLKFVKQDGRIETSHYFEWDLWGLDENRAGWQRHPDTTGASVK